jgi:hypothetical protein
MQWLRLYHDTPTDPKWRLVAAESGQSEAIVLAIWIHMMVNASQGKQRGVLEDWDDRIVAASMGLRGDVVAAVRSAMQGVVLDGDRLTGWDKRQRTSDSAAERMKKSRARKAANPDGDGGGGGTQNSQNGPETSLKSNGAHPSYGNSPVTGSDSHVTEHLGNVTEHSEDVTQQPLRAQTPELQIEESKTTLPPDVDSHPARGCEAERVVGEVGRLTGLPATEKNREIAEGWLRKGWDAEQDILPAIQDWLRKPSYPLDEIRSFAFFRDAIDAHRARRLNPQVLPPRLTVVPSGGKPLPKAVLDLRELKQRYTGGQP